MEKNWEKLKKIGKNEKKFEKIEKIEKIGKNRKKWEKMGKNGKISNASADAYGRCRYSLY